MGTLTDLETRLRRDNERRQAAYAYARSLGFSAAAASLLRMWSKAKINKLAQERDRQSV